MSAPFPDHDFLCGSWRPLDGIARKTDGGFPVKLPLLNALAFDEVKNSVCAYRGWRLCSVDAVTIAADGRIFLIEFKDTRKNPIAQLKKKGFDSLFLFWTAVGHSLTMNEIRNRAVFCYVTAPEVRYDDEIHGALEKLAGHRPTVSKPDQLEELRSTGLYGDVRHLGPREFRSMMKDADVVQTIDELRAGVSITYHLPRPMRLVPRVRDDAADFKSSVCSIAELRMAYPFDQKMKRSRSYEVLRVADAYDADDEKVSWVHDWRQPYPAMALMTCCFDTFMLWCLAYHSDARIDRLGSRLKGLIAFKGDPLTTLEEPSRAGSCEYRHCFWEVYSQEYAARSRYGVSVLEQNGMYGEICCRRCEDGAVK